MTDLNQFTGDNMGGIRTVKFIPANQVTTIPDPVNHIIATAITITGSWFDAYFSEQSMSVQEPDEETENGKLWRPVVRGFVPKDEEVNKDNMEEMRLHRFILDVVDHNGQRKIYGSKQAPLEFLYNLDTRDETSGRNGHEIIWRSRNGLAHPGYFYNP